MFATLFFPGRGIGYFFVIGNLIAMLILTSCLELPSRGSDNILFTAMMGAGYLAAYVGLANLIMRASARWGREGAVRGLFVNLALVLLGVFIPLSIQWSNPGVYGPGYHPIQATNVFWTMAELTDADLSDIFALQPNIFIVPLLVGLAAILMLVTNFILAAHQILAARAAVPVRVQQEQLSQRGEQSAASRPQSLWDAGHSSTAKSADDGQSSG